MAPPRTHHLERSTGEPNEQSHSGGAATLLPLSPAGWRIKPPERSSKRTNRTPKSQPPCTRCLHLDSQHEQRSGNQRRHELHWPPEAEEEWAGTLLFPLTATAGPEKKPHRAHRCSPSSPATTVGRGRKKLPPLHPRPARRPFIGVAGGAPPPHLAHTTGAPQGDKLPLTGLDLDRRSESPSRQDPKHGEKRLKSIGQRPPTSSMRREVAGAPPQLSR
jgi:hypothetical protein